MADNITFLSDPTLWATLVTYTTDRGWAVVDGVHYEKHQAFDGSLFFVVKEALEMVDSRSIRGGVAASYSKLDS